MFFGILLIILLKVCFYRCFADINLKIKEPNEVALASDSSQHLCRSTHIVYTLATAVNAFSYAQSNTCTLLTYIQHFSHQDINN